MHAATILLAMLLGGGAVLGAPASTSRSDVDHAAKRLIQLAADAPPQWLSESDLRKLYSKHAHFMDITDTPDLDAPSASFAEPAAIPSEPTQQQAVQPMLARANTALMKTFLANFTAFNNRYYRSESGAQSAKFLYDTVQQLAETGNPGGLNVTVIQFKHSWAQSSVIARIEGLHNNQETVVVGAHQDSVNGRNPMTGRAPGADDDGSGSATILEAFRVLLASKFQPLRPVEFQWYAGEEAGLLGSQAIAQAYKSAGRIIAGMMQLDMTMFPTKSRPDIGLVSDFTDKSLTALVAKLVGAYTPLTAKAFACGYGCSDHASWNKAGYPSVMPFESSNMHENKVIHTERDDLGTLDFDHGLQLAKLAVGYVVEMSHQ